MHEASDEYKCSDLQQIWEYLGVDCPISLNSAVNLFEKKFVGQFDRRPFETHAV